MVLKLGVRNVGRTFQRLFREEYWNVGIVNVPIETMLSEPVPSSVSWIPSSTTSYYADPFGLYEDEKVTVYMEEMKPYRVNGVVSRASYTREDQGVQYEEEAVLQQRNHLSYPYLFREYGDVYCVPETAGRNEVSLYRWCAESQCFAHEETLINNMKAIDSTLFYDGECWWLFCTVLKENRESHNSELHLFYSDQLKSGWKPHPLNPVKIDSRSSRSAGTPFHVDGTWYRPAQDCSVTYGGAVVFNKIITLTIEQYEEQVVTTITPCKESDFPDGIHTLSSVGPYTLLDGKCFRYHLFTPFRKWIQKTMAIYE
ncbi:hypothetical protein [Geomicrobium sp. JCM 19055]|uniref:glucosamine inositolphosphorylceramide transferase family protein n=1 Tax=Geomicrobium sp. JCM 19055 TaxID=1460649 RepID=UPI00045ED1E2|nr:hypothetical protein [Geomicrobium sp. JCM 19055]GAJ98051.1 hypothetical protein JCM19055_953 [Geomicrobium sp. JCM 19055]